MNYIFCRNCGRAEVPAITENIEEYLQQHPRCEYCASEMSIGSNSYTEKTHETMKETGIQVYEQFIKGDPLKEIIYKKRKEEVAEKHRKFEEELDREIAQLNAPIRCPKCGHASVVTGTRGFSVWTGFFGSNKTMNRCGNCGYKWYP